MHPPRRTLVRAVGFVGILAFFAGCGGPSFTANVFTDGPLSYRVGNLAGDWRQAQVENNDLAFSHADGSLIQVNSSCDRTLDAPLTVLTNHLLVMFTEREFQEQVLEQLDGREALRTRMTAKLDGVPRQLELIVMKKNGCVFDLALITGPDPMFTARRETFMAFSHEFQVTSP